jgi:UDP-2,3-diacylglucosamine hydrolase
MQLPPGKKIYFLSDFHLGAPDHAASLKRERHIVKFLEKIKNDAAVIFIVGDLFDFWYEYKKVVPKGFVRILGKLAELTDSGIEINFFVGNHDMWMNGYFEEELNVKVYFDPEEFTYNGKVFLIGHGDGIGPGDHKYKFIKKVFRNKVSQGLFGSMHPHWGIGLANYFSRKSRKATGTQDQHFLGEENEWQIIFSKEMLEKKHYDYFIFGHRHLPMKLKLGENSLFINLGDWITYFSYASFSKEGMELNYFPL